VNRSIKLFGIRALSKGAAAIVSVGDEPPHEISLGGRLGEDSTLAQVRARSIIVDHNGARSEVFLPSTVTGPTIYVR
jgi:general secretion pathway protein C